MLWKRKINIEKADQSGRLFPMQKDNEIILLLSPK